jgi:uncharacterized OB-fold protein
MVGRPRPLPDDASAPYWAAACKHRLKFPFCTTCQRWFHPLNLFCPNGHDTSEYRELSGHGTLYTYTTVRDKSTMGMDPPYLIGLVTLDEQDDLCLVANLLELREQQPTIGMPLEVTFEEIAPDCTLPQFRPSRGA